MMTKTLQAARVALLLLAVGALVATVWRPRPAGPQPAGPQPAGPQPLAARVALAAPNVFAGPVNGGCYLATATTCRIHVDNWQPITSDAGRVLRGFRLSAGANGTETLLYDFRTDVSNPPAGSYLPSLVRQDFAARCDTTYRLTLHAQDSGDSAYELVGHTSEFQCPAATAFYNYLPLARR